MCAFKPGDFVKANFTFEKDKTEDLSFKKNDTLRIIKVAKESNWAHAKNRHGETGLIPLNYVQPTELFPSEISDYDWFHGPITRMDSETLLTGRCAGSFLVRESDLHFGDLTLCVVGPPQDCTQAVPHATEAVKDPHCFAFLGGSTNIQHYRIMRRKMDALSTSLTKTIKKLRYTLDEQDWFSDLSDLIEYYSWPDRGLVFPLLHPVSDMHRKRLRDLKQKGWIVTRKELILGDRIGHGEFGEVMKATYHGDQVAVKIYKNTASKLAVAYEASLMSNLSHPNLVSFIGLVYEPDEAVYLITEYLANGSLLAYLHSRTRDEVMQTTKLHFSIDVCQGMVYLEERNLIHRDIAARNILLSGQAPNLVAKVADFGMARDLNDPLNVDTVMEEKCSESHEPHRTLVLTSRGCSKSTSFTAGRSTPTAIHDNAAIPLKWTAPEAVRDRLFTSKSDVWSFGILLWEIYSYGRIPYPRMLAHQVLKHIESGYRMKAPEGCPPNIYALMDQTWQIDPADRPSFSELLEKLLGQVGVTTPSTRLNAKPTCREPLIPIDHRVPAQNVKQQQSEKRLSQRMLPKNLAELMDNCIKQTNEIDLHTVDSSTCPCPPAKISVKPKLFPCTNRQITERDRYKSPNIVCHNSRLP